MSEERKHFPDSKFGAIMCDPPWQFTTYSDKGKGKSADQHYDCVRLADLKEWNVVDLAAEDCAMFMWATMPMLPEALELMAAWGFKFKSAAAWAKQSKTGKKWAFGTGYVFRNAAEMLLVGTRGKPKWQSRSERGLIIAPVREHSRKPEGIHDMIERMVAGPYIELFARQSRPNWVTWGNQAELFDEAA